MHLDSSVDTKTVFFLVTNWHVATGCRPSNGHAIHESKAVPARLRATSMVIQHEPKRAFVGCTFDVELHKEEGPIWFEHPEYKEQVDVVAIPVVAETEDGVKVPYFEIGVDLQANESSRLWIMDRVFIVGFPLTEIMNNTPFPIYKAGTVASEPDFHYGIPRFYVDGKTKKGMSGSPVVRGQNLRLEEVADDVGIRGHATTLIGVYSGRDRQEVSEFEAELGIVWPLKECVVPVLEAAVAATK